MEISAAGCAGRSTNETSANRISVMIVGSFFVALEHLPADAESAVDLAFHLFDRIGVDDMRRQMGDTVVVDIDLDGPSSGAGRAVHFANRRILPVCRQSLFDRAGQNDFAGPSEAGLSQDSNGRAYNFTVTLAVSFDDSDTATSTSLVSIRRLCVAQRS
jgi:hypothetical protein